MDIRLATVGILNKADSVVGTGFIASAKGLVVTCAHVVRKAGSQPGGSIKVRYLANGALQNAEVPVKWWRGESDGDISVLQLIGDLPNEVRVLPLGGSVGTERHPFSTHGFPKLGSIDSLPAIGQIVGPNTQRGHSILTLQANSVTLGFSGAAAWDDLRRRVIGMVVAVAPEDEIGRLADVSFLVPSERIQQVCSELVPSDLCPYQGLDPFDEKSAEFFFGRDKASSKLGRLLTNGTRFLAIVGPMGSGKSSLLGARLVPELRRQCSANGKCGRTILFKPGANPYQTLQESGVVCEPGELAKTATERLASDTCTCKLTLVVDQFEDVFVSCDSRIRDTFIADLDTLLNACDRAAVVISMRYEWLPQLFGKEGPLTSWLQKENAIQPIPLQLDKDELIQVIREPADKCGWHFEPDTLPEELANEAIRNFPLSPEDGTKGSATLLPYLELALTELWRESRQSGMLRSSVFDTSGRLEGTIQRWAEKSFTNVRETDKSLAEAVLAELVHLVIDPDSGTGYRIIRKRQNREKLCEYFLERKRVDQVIEALKTARLVRSNGRYVELVHDVLAERWPRLRSLVTADADFHAWIQDVSNHAARWSESCAANRPTGDSEKLLHGEDLNQATRWLIKRENKVPERIRSLIDASCRFRDRAIRRQKQTAVVIRSAVFIALVFGLIAWFLYAATKARARRLALLTDGLLVKALSAEADDKLWPPYPQNISLMEDWLERVRELKVRITFDRESLQQSHSSGVGGKTETWERQVLQQGIDASSALFESKFADVQNRLMTAHVVQNALTNPSWSAAISSISNVRECPLYKGMRIDPQIGLLPIGRNEHTGLWEFAHLASGQLPKRNFDGSFALESNMCLVFVLIPAGSFAMGAVRPARTNEFGPNLDPDADDSTGPTNTVTLGPFYLSKYEMTQGQWQKCFGFNPSMYQEGFSKFITNHLGACHPVEQVSWNDCARLLPKFGLALPTEAQWEYASRAGTRSIWWTGDIRNSIEQAANVRDLAAKASGLWGDNDPYENWNDKNAIHAPVGSFSPNAFGLYDTMGNVQEWCRDRFANDYRFPVLGIDGERSDPKSRERVLRGGGYGYRAEICRSAQRYGINPSDSSPLIGVRPMIQILGQNH